MAGEPVEMEMAGVVIDMYVAAEESLLILSRLRVSHFGALAWRSTDPEICNALDDISEQLERVKAIYLNAVERRPTAD